jgi:hypothetical protein
MCDTGAASLIPRSSITWAAQVHFPDIHDFDFFGYGYEREAEKGWVGHAASRFACEPKRLVRASQGRLARPTHISI